MRWMYLKRNFWISSEEKLRFWRIFLLKIMKFDAILMVLVTFFEKSHLAKYPKIFLRKFFFNLYALSVGSSLRACHTFSVHHASVAAYVCCRFNKGRKCQSLVWPKLQNQNNFDEILEYKKILKCLRIWRENRNYIFMYDVFFLYALKSIVFLQHCFSSGCPRCSWTKSLSELLFLPFFALSIVWMSIWFLHSFASTPTALEEAEMSWDMLKPIFFTSDFHKARMHSPASVPSWGRSRR